MNRISIFCATLVRAAPLILAPAVFALNEARAESPTADTLFKEGKALLAQRRHREACIKLAESHRIDPSGGTILYLALCHKEEGRLATARRALDETIAFAIRDKREDREEAARTLMAEIEPSLMKLRVAVAPESAGLSHFEVRCDGALITPQGFGTAFAVDPGLHTVTAWAPGRKPLVITAEVQGPGTTTEVMIGALEVEPGADLPDALDRARNHGAVKAPSRPVEDDGPPHRAFVPSVILGSVGLTALGVGAAFTAQAIEARNASASHCDTKNVCDEEGLRLRDRAVTSATAATVTMIAGAGASAAALGLLIWSPWKRPSSGGAFVTGVFASPTGIWAKGAW